MLLGLRTQTYPVADLAAAKAWWTKILGFGPYFEEPFYVGFDVGGYELGLVPRGDGGSRDGPTTLWGVPDARVALAALVAAGAQVREDVSDVGDGILVASVTEPGGAVLGIVENPNFAVRPVDVPPGAGPGR
ncbi:MAG: VOC family protein [Acidimicrobiales bacterium]